MPAVNYLGLYGGVTGQEPVLTQAQFLQQAMLRPQDIFAGIQAGVEPGMLEEANRIFAETIQQKIKEFQDLQVAINKAMAELFKSAIQPPATVEEARAQLAKGFQDYLTQYTEAAQQNLDRQRIALLDLTDPGAILEQVAVIKQAIQDRYQGEIEIVARFASELDQLAGSWRAVSASLAEQVDQLRLSQFGPPDPMAQYQLALERGQAALAAFNAAPSPATAQAVQQLVDPLLQAASQIYDRPSMEYQRLFADVVAALEGVQAQADEQAKGIEDILVEALGEGNTLASITAENTAKIAEAMEALHEDALSFLGAAGWGPDSPISQSLQKLIDEGITAIPAAIAMPTDAQIMILLLAQIAQNTVPVGAPAPIEPATVVGTPEWYQAMGWVPLQHGTPYVEATQPYLLHQGEAVLSPAVAARWRAGEASGGGVTIQIGEINISGHENPRAAMREVIDELETQIRSGRLGRAILERVR